MTNLSNTDGLLFHDLMYGSAVILGHLVELVDAAHSLVRQHQRASFQHHLACEGILGENV